jgi:hypothetical protein
MDGSSTSRSGVEVATDYLAVGDADGSVRLMQLDVDDTVSHDLISGTGTHPVWHKSWC